MTPLSPLSDTNHLSIMELPTVLTQLFERGQRPLLEDAQGDLGLFVRYLRRKPARGLAVIYTVDEISSSQKMRTNNPQRALSLTLDEQALDGAQIRFNALQVQHTPLEVIPPGILHAPELGISVQRFPADGGLPALAASCDTTPGPVFEALQAAARTQLHDPAWLLVSAQALPVRYKPGNRCVIRYQLQLQHPARTALKALMVFGKVYADPAQARSVQALQQQLYTEQEQTGVLPLLPRPLGLLDELGLTFNEAIQVSHADERDEPWNVLRTGTQALRPHVEYGRGGEVTRVSIPEEELRLAGQALARLHNSTLRPNADKPRTGAKEAKRAEERASLIAHSNPAHAQETQQLARTLAERLKALEPDMYLPAHGGFKSSQLLLHSHNVFVVDFDGFCLADPALDVGYFLAYLRPSGLWYQQQGSRQWFAEAASVFRNSYTQAMLAQGATHNTTGILERARLYEAALIFKIATRRVNRLNSPRPQELAAMLDEISVCLA